MHMHMHMHLLVLLSFDAAAAFGVFGVSPSCNFSAGDLSRRGELVGVFDRGGPNCKDFIEKDFIAKVTHNKHLYTFQNEDCINTFMLQLYPPRVSE